MPADPWPTKRCPEPLSLGRIVEQFDTTLGEAIDERPLQKFLAAHPYLLAPLLPPGNGAWCFDRPRFGSEHIPDFLLCTHTSNGYDWVLVELESPTTAILTSQGLPAKKTNEALTQVRDWRAWLRQEIAYVQGTLGYRDLNVQARAFVVIGRRDSLDAKQARRYAELSTAETTVMTYDRLRESIIRGRQLIGVEDG